MTVMIGLIRERKKPVYMSEEPIFFWITDAYCESLVRFRMHICVSVPQSILPEPDL